MRFLGGVDADNLKLVPRDWNSYSTTSAADGIITYHGTVGVEAASLGKPVLLADRGWYHELGFAKFAESRDDYVNIISRPWWTEADSEMARHNALIFAGMFFAVPGWQRKLVFADDALQEKLYLIYETVDIENSNELRHELESLNCWYKSDEKYYHIYKMKRAEQFCPPTMPSRALPR